MIINNGTAVRFRREFMVPVEVLYRAWTDPKSFKSWWQGTSVAEFDFRVGGSYLIKWTNPPEDYARGTYTEIIPYEKIVMTWDTSEICAGKSVTPVKDSLITLKFTSISDTVSRLELTHEKLSADRLDDHSWGWTDALLDLDRRFNVNARQIDPKLVVDVTRTLPFAVAKVYGAWTDPTLLNRWFNSSGHTQGLAMTSNRVGGAYSLDYQMPSGEILRVHGAYQEIVPNQKLAFTWIDDNHSDVTIHKQYPSKVCVTFKELGPNTTEISVRHSDLTMASEMEEFISGWEGCLRSIEQELAN